MINVNPELQTQAIEILKWICVITTTVFIFFRGYSRLIQKYGKEKIDVWTKTIGRGIDTAQDLIPALKIGGVGVTLDTLEIMLNGFENLDNSKARHEEAKKFILNEILLLGGNPNLVDEKYLDFAISGLVRLFGLNETEQAKKKLLIPSKNAD